MNVVPSQLAEAIIGSLFAAIGLAAAIAGISARPRREFTAVWFGVFCLLYGVRLAAKSDLIQAVTAWPEPIFEYIEAFITYTILIPGGLFVETLIGPGAYRLIRRTWQVTCVYALASIVYDLSRAQPYASMRFNAPVVLLTILIYVPHLVARARGRRWPIAGRAVAATLSVFTLVVIYETVSRRGVFGPDLDAEPFAMMMFTAALGWFVLTRAREQAYGFVALSRELELARDIQRSLLPQEMPNVPGLRITGTYLPMNAVAGDFYDVAQLPDSRILMIVADVSGHGVPAALVASMVKVAFAAESERYDRPGEILGGINRALTGKFDRAYITACCMVVDRARGRIAYAAAGHPPALLRRLDGRLEKLDEGGIVLTVLPGATYATTEVPFYAGDRLLLFTDGLLEATHESGDEFFGDAELARVVAAVPPHADVTQAVLHAHRRWIGTNAPLADDLTLVVVDCL